MRFSRQAILKFLIQLFPQSPSPGLRSLLADSQVLRQLFLLFLLTDTPRTDRYSSGDKPCSHRSTVILATIVLLVCRNMIHVFTTGAPRPVPTKDTTPAFLTPLPCWPRSLPSVPRPVPVSPRRFGRTCLALFCRPVSQHRVCWMNPLDFYMLSLYSEITLCQVKSYKSTAPTLARGWWASLRSI